MSGESPTILLVEDEALIALSEKKTLEKHGFRVLVAHSGEKAVKLVESGEAVDLVLMDINLGKGIDGTEAASQILAIRDLPLIFLSSHTEPEIVQKTEGISSFGYIVKDSEETVLIASIKMAFRLFSTRLREKENKLHKISLELFRTMFEQSAVGVARVLRDGLLANVNERFTRITGYSREELATMNFRDITHPDDLHLDESHIQKVIAGKIDAFEIEKRYIHKEGHPIWIKLYSNVVRNMEGEIEYAIAVIVDISKRKQIEEDFSRNQANLQALIENISGSIWSIDRNYRLIAGNSSFHRDIESVKGRPYQAGDHLLDQLFEKEILEKWKDCYDQAFNGEAFSIQSHREFIDPTRVFEYRFHPIKDDHEEVQGVTVFGRDITEEISAQRALKESEQQKDLILNATSELVAYYDTEMRVIWANRSSAKSVGLTIDDLVGKRCHQIWQNRDTPCENCPVLKAKQEKRPVQGEMKTPDDRHWFIRGFPVLNENQEVVGLVEFGQDITEQKQVDLSLRESEERFKTVLEDLPGGVFAHDLDGNILFVNHAAASNTGYSREELLEMKVSDIDPASVTRKDREHLWQSMRKGDSIILESQHIRKDGSAYTAEIRLNAVTLDGKPIILPIAFDITDRKKSEERVNHLLNEKTLLLREVHHRIKNNMVSMKSLLGLQAERSRSGSAKAALKAAENRLASMMVLYDKLYRGDSISNISIRDYLSSLIDQIVATSPTQITINKVIDDVMIPVNTASSLGIIINELISNAVKYAFAGTDRNQIDIILEKTESTATLMVRDNGQGFDTSQVHKGFGLELVESLVGQIDGRFAIEGQGGTTCTLQFGLEN